MLYLCAHMCTDVYMYVHICIHCHICSFFVYTYKSTQRVIFWMTNKYILCDTSKISSRVNTFYPTHESISFYSPYLFDHVSKHSDPGPVPTSHGIRYYGSTRHGRWCTFTRRWHQVQTQVHTNVHLSGRISEYGMICIDIYAYIYMYIYIYRNI